VKGVTRQPTQQLTLGQVWGAAIAARRKVLGLTQAELCRRCNVTQQTISKIEHGEMIPLDRLKVAIATALCTTPADLFQWPSGITAESVAS
jgi:transcriptional regulator with XRE-family HTH domain